MGGTIIRGPYPNRNLYGQLFTTMIVIYWESYRNMETVNPRNTPHLFNCPTKPTPHAPEDLWLQPVKLYVFLNLNLNPNQQNSKENLKLLQQQQL